MKEKPKNHTLRNTGIIILFLAIMGALSVNSFDIGDTSVCPNSSIAATTSGLWTCQSANFVNWTNGTQIITRIDTIQTQVNQLNTPNITSGIATLSGGTATITTTAIHYNSKVFYNYQNSTGLNTGTLIERNRIEGTSFDIKDITSILDTNTIAWQIIN